MLSKFLIIFILFMSTLQAITITGIGYGENQKASLKESFANLSNKISTNVKSDFKTFTKSIDGNIEERHERIIQLSSNLPIKNVIIEHIKQINGQIKTISTISSKKSLSTYIQTLIKLKKQIDGDYLKIMSLKKVDVKYLLLNELLTNITNFEKYKIVAIILEGKKLPVLNISSNQILSQIKNIEQIAPSIEIASSILTKGIDVDSIYLSAIKTSTSNEITQFSRVIKQSMSQHLNTVKKPNDAKYFIEGSYEILKDKIFVSTQLNDGNNILKTTTVTLDKKAYSNLAYIPLTQNFDASLHSGFIKNGNLYVNVGFRGFNRVNGIDLIEGDKVDIVLKTNKPICYFLVGHILQYKSTFSYLLPIGSGNTPFVNKLTGEDVNQNIIIANDIPIEEPFGCESLQVFAGTFNKYGNCTLEVPDCVENEEGYCVVNKIPSDAIVNTRALNLKKRQYEIEKAENSIIWTSFQR